MKEIKKEFALECIKEYHELMKNLGVDSHAKQTNCVSFNTAKLRDYLNNHDLQNNSDEIKIFFGVYPKNIPSDMPDAKPGRLTAIMWPHKGGKPSTKPASGKDGGIEEIAPLNYAELTP
ncbi:MAG: hypothetical protein ABIP95_03815 [Pelobium sp.]